ncbi:MAG: bifunctional phosphoribosylaminoimidazolecarboxamide formyltransferase/IMP cyclohydrolase [Calditrichaceae bacterium]|nr:bifunctional phosphoribosylaminoimidazolecarboxamide formyltransferase/IMP cyclohydrolase [Calditrichaceae bacterium]RQV96686.1 MAG: bifunctional phosphoribosylaminoimidazolecarboxamide formyltransferase/IMP cyclohydrolase PurH [Calditrichota bacterium]
MQQQLIKIKKVLISVSDKTGIVELAEALKKQDCEIISTGGTRKELEKAGINVMEISRVTGNPEAFGGRMKTISFQIESAILFDREIDAGEARLLGIEPIDMVVSNLYPFEKMLEKSADLDTLIENIDIGGPTMVRAAAKNFKYVAVVTDPDDYQSIISELKENDGTLGYDTRFKLMRKAFNRTADYDAAIASAFDQTAGELSVRLAFSQAKELRYGENSHQKAYFLRQHNASHSLYDIKVLHGKELSYNNIVDMYSAIDVVRDLKQYGCAVIKHNNPCGLCSGDNPLRVFQQAWAGDPVSAFGSVIAFNKPLDKKTLEFLELDNENKALRKFVEVIVAPGYTDDALEYLYQNKNLRVVEFDPAALDTGQEVKILYNAALIQNADRQLADEVKPVTKIAPKAEKDLVEFGLITVRQLRSNAIVVVRKTKTADYQLLGMGCGQPNRVNSTQLAVKRCHENLKMEYDGPAEKLNDYIKNEMGKAVLVSDAFFPFPDNIEIAADAHIRTIYQPGGSIRDKSVIEKCDELGIAMGFTGIRHFKH